MRKSTAGSKKHRRFIRRHCSWEIDPEQQIPHVEVLASAARQPAWTADGFRSWCQELDDAGGIKLKADLLVGQTRALQPAETSAAVKRKPAAALADPGLRH